jgi:hypothetical protein
MHSIKQVSFCFQLFIGSAAILMALTVPMDLTRHEPSEDLCSAGASHPSKLDMRSLENRGYCHYKVCDNKYGYKNGKTRNPDVIHRIVCEETTTCKQVYLTEEVAYYTNGSLTRKKNETVPNGCLYSEIDLRDSSTVDTTEPSNVS